MFIYDPEVSLFFLLNALQRAKYRVTFSIFIVGGDYVSRLIFNEINKSHLRGCKVTMYGRAEFLFSEFHYGERLIHPDIPIIDPGHGSHAKIWIIDDLVISTDRNLSGDYYGKNPNFKSCDLIFESKLIANTVHDYLEARRCDLLRVSDGNYILYLGRLGPLVKSFLTRNTNVKVITCTFWPSTEMQQILIKNKHTVIASDISPRSSKWFFRDGCRTCLMMTGIPGITYVNKDSFHYKVFITENSAWHGSFNLDIASEFYVLEQMVITRDKNEIKSLNCLWNNLMKDSYLINRVPPFPGMKVVDFIAENVLHLWRRANSEDRRQRKIKVVSSSFKKKC